MAERVDFHPSCVLVTGGCGFIGSNFLQRHVPALPHTRFVVLDALTYAANPRSIEGLECPLLRVDIRESARLDAAFDEVQPDAVVHFAAESHVDRSIHGPRDFVETNVLGTFNLLESTRKFSVKRFLHVSTDEVYGSLGATGKFTEETPYDPSSPYSASKAASDHLVKAYHRTYGLDTLVTNCSNNYGPRQFPEKLIPLMILNALEHKPLPVYGDGMNVRDWLHVEDHAEALWIALCRGRSGETYNIGGDAERTNIDVVRLVCRFVAEATDGQSRDPLITYVKDRPGHDRRYAIDASKMRDELGWRPRRTFEEGLRETVQWYLENPGWVQEVRSGDYLKWIETHYGVA